MATALLTVLRELMTPPVFESDEKTATAAHNLLLSGVLLGIVTPVLVVVALTIESISSLVWIATGALVILVVTLVALTHRKLPTQGAVVFLVGVWALFSWAAWMSGGIFSAAICAQFIVVALAEATHRWRWALAAGALALITVVTFTWAGAHNLVPDSAVVTTPMSYGAIVGACLLALAVTHGMIGAQIRSAGDRVVQELEESRIGEQRLQDLVDNAPFGAFLCELVRGRHLRVAHANLNASVALGKDASQFVGGDLGNVFAATADDGLLERLRQVAVDGDSFHADDVTVYSGGAKRTLEVHAYQGEPGVIAVFFVDITQRRAAEAEIQRIAFHDELTSLPNRKLLLDRLGVALEGARRRGSGVALLFIDLDEFKPLNDRFGHAFGDLILAAVGERLGSIARASDTVARIGGDEFIVLIPDVSSREQVEIVADKFVAAFQKPFQVGGQQVVLTASVGVALSAEHDVGPHTLLEYADMAMYESKRTGRNGYRFR